MDNFASEKHFPLLSMQAQAENLTCCHVSLHQGPQNTNEKHSVSRSSKIVHILSNLNCASPQGSKVPPKMPFTVRIKP